MLPSLSFSSPLPSLRPMVLPALCCHLLALSLSLSLSANLSSQFYTVLKNKVITNISANIVAFLYFLGPEKKILLQHITSAESLSLAAPKGLKLLKEVHF